MEGSGQLPSGAVLSRIDADRISRLLPLVFGSAVAAILVAKLLLAWRININWDEFFYLSHVYALARGDLDLLLQGAYTHLFRWTINVPGNEVDQIVAARLSMWALFALSIWLLYRLARTWASQSAAAFAVLAFAGSLPVLRHGAAFRADSILLPLMLGALLMALHDKGRRSWNDVGAGLCLGAAFTLTSKAVLLLPMLLAMMLLPAGSRRESAPASSASDAAKRVATTLASAALFAAVLIAAHATQVAATAENVGSFASRSIVATLIDLPLFPRGAYFMRLFSEDLIFWLAALAGLIVAGRNRAYGAAAAILSLLPIIFYRNAFPYYYPLMMAPAAILVAMAADLILEGSWARQRRFTGPVALGVLGLMVMHGAWDDVMTLRFDEQKAQRSVVAAVHQVFPDPVPYLDHSGMIASFPKVNFFMSSWGVENYLRAGRDFMPEALRTRRPPLLLVNHGVLRPGTLLFSGLRDVDRKLLTASYVDYWGPIRVAGVATQVAAGRTTNVHLPFPGLYRIEAGNDVLVNGERFSPGEILDTHGTVDFVMSGAPGSGADVPARLVWAEVRKPPSEAPPDMPFYSPL